MARVRAPHAMGLIVQVGGARGAVRRPVDRFLRHDCCHLLAVRLCQRTLLFPGRRPHEGQVEVDAHQVLDGPPRAPW
jgi:hypothetical protein